MAKSRRFTSKKCEYNGIKFDSKLELEFYLLKLKEEEQGEISELTTQVKYVVQEGFRDNNGTKILPITYTCDHQWIDTDGVVNLSDTKASDYLCTNEFKLKWKMMKYRYRDFKYHLIVKYGGVFYDLENPIEKKKYKEAKKSKKKK